MTRLDSAADLGLPEDERVEDAGLEYDEMDDPAVASPSRTPSKKKVAA